MSYDTAFKKNQQVDDGDNESLQDPLLSKEFKNTCQSIESSLQAFGYKLRDLEKFMEMVGTVKDNEELRVQINESLTKCMTQLKQSQSLISKFGDTKTSNPKETNMKKDKLKAFNHNLEEMTRKFQVTSQKLKEKQQLFIELAQKSRNSSVNQSTDNDEQNPLMQIRKQDQMRLIAETDNMEEVITQRKKEITQIESIMTNINAIAKDIAMETQKQGEKVKRLDENMTVAAVNTKAGLGELEQAQGHQKKGQKCLIIILLIALVIIGIVLAAVFA